MYAYGLAAWLSCCDPQAKHTSSLLMNLLASIHGTSEAAMTLCGVVMLLGDHIHVHIQGHLLALIVVCCASMACVVMAELGSAALRIFT